MSTQVQVDLIADAKAVSQEINRTIREISLMGKAIDTNNDLAVKSWKKAAEAAHEYADAAGATHEQQLRLSVATRATEDRIDSMGEKYARAGERGERALSNMMRTGELTGRSVNNLVAAAGDLGFAFGPAGAIVAGIAMVGLAVVTHLERAEVKLEDIADKFTHHMNEMLMNGSAVDAAKAAGKAYITELEAIAKVKRDQAEGISSIWGAVTGSKNGIPFEQTPDIVQILRAIHAHGDSDAVDVAHNEGNADRAASSRLSKIEAHDPQLKTLEKERKQANDDIARAEEKLRTLDATKNRSEIAGLNEQKTQAERRLADLELQTVALEGARRQLVEHTVGEDSTVAAIKFGASKFKEADFGAEHEARDTGADRNADGARGRRRDQDRAAATAERLAQAKRDQAADREIAAMKVRTLEDNASHMDVASPQGALSELAVIQAKREQERQRIEEMGVNADRKKQLQAAADEEELGAVRALNNRIEAENKRHDDAEDKRSRADEAKEVAATKKKIQMIEQAERHGIEAMLSGKKDIGRQLLKIALEPLAQTLEGWAAFYTEKAAAEAVSGDYAQAAKDFGAAAIDLGGAAAVRAIGGGGGSSGGGGGGGGGGAGSGAGMGAQFGTSSASASQQLLKIEIVTVTKDQTGRETARTSQMIQRLTDLNMPIRVAL
jgi:hypothetical protein